MRWSVVQILFWKEFLDIVRDRRTIVSMILVPVLLYPLLLVGFSHLLAAKAGEVRSSQFAVTAFGIEHAPDLEARLQKDEQVLLQWLDAPEGGAMDSFGERLRSGEERVILIVPVDFQEQVTAGGSAEIQVLYNGADDFSNAARLHIQEHLREYRADLLEIRLAQHDLPESFATPVRIAPKDMADKTERGAYIIGRIVSMLVILMAAMGAFYPAVDMASGEKERGTMETLLVSPASRLEIVLGKYVAVTLVCIATAVMNLASMSLTFSEAFTGALKMDAAFSPSVGMVIAVFVTLIPMAAFFSALCLGVSSFASSYKEAMVYMSPVMLIAMVGAYAPLLPGISAGYNTALVPVVNTSLLAYSLLQGKATVGLFAITMLSNVVMAAIALAWTKNLFEQESILVRGGSEFDWRFWTWNHGSSIPNATQAFVIYLVAMAAMFFGGQRLVRMLGEEQLVVVHVLTQVIFLLVLTMVAVRLFGARLKPTLHLNRPPIFEGVAGLLMACSWMFVIAGVMGLLQKYEIGMSPEDEEKAIQTYGFLLELPWHTKLLMGAIVPAICEEVLFRGMVLSSFRKRFGPALAIALCGLMFGFMHPLPIQKVITGVFGMVIALVVLKTGSLYIGIGMHFVNNALALFVGEMIGDSVTADSGEWMPPMYLWIPAALILIGGLAWFCRRPWSPESATEN